MNRCFFPYYLSIMPILLFIGILCYNFSETIEPLIFVFALLYVITLIYTVLCFGWLSLYAIFLYTSCFFLFTNVFLTGIDSKHYNFLQATFPMRYMFDIDIGIKFIISAYIMIFVTHCSYCVLPRRKRNKSNIIETDLNWINIGIIIMLFAFLPVLYKFYLQLDFVSKHGYESIFTGKMKDIDYPIWTTGSFILFSVGYVLLISGNPNKKKFIIFSFLYFLVLLADSLKGQRGPVLGLSVSIIYLLKKIYKQKFHFRTIILMSSVIIILIVGIGIKRDFYGKNKKPTNSVISTNAVLNTLARQSSSNVVPMLIIKGQLSYHPYPFVFSPLLQPFVNHIYPSNGQDEIAATKHNNISHVTMYNVSRSAYLAGSGYGGAFLAEAYDCGGILGVFFWSVILANLLKFFDYSFVFISKKLKPFFLCVLFKIPMMPRQRLFGFFYDYFYIIICSYIVILFIEHILKKSRRIN